MQFLGIELKRPASTKWAVFNWVSSCAAAGLLLGFVIQQVTDGSFRSVIGMGAAGIAAGALIVCGADLDRAGWRGVGLCVAGAMLAFLMSDLVSAP